MNPYDDLFDDPEDAPEDIDEIAPGDVLELPEDELGFQRVVYDTLPLERYLDPSIRERRRRRIADMQATQEYRNVRREELRSRYGGSHIT